MDTSLWNCFLHSSQSTLRIIWLTKRIGTEKKWKVKLKIGMKKRTNLTNTWKFYMPFRKPKGSILVVKTCNNELVRCLGKSKKKSQLLSWSRNKFNGINAVSIKIERLLVFKGLLNTFRLSLLIPNNWWRIMSNIKISIKRSLFKPQKLLCKSSKNWSILMNKQRKETKTPMKKSKISKIWSKSYIC